MYDISPKYARRECGKWEEYRIFALHNQDLIAMTTLKRMLPDLVAIILFALLSFTYFFPADIEGRMLFQHDTAAGVGIGQEAKEYYEQTGERTRWTNSVFGGMPTYQISPSYDSNKPLQWVQKVYQLFLPSYVCLTFILMLGFYILLRTFGLSVPTSSSSSRRGTSGSSSPWPTSRPHWQASCWPTADACWREA